MPYEVFARHQSDPLVISCLPILQPSCASRNFLYKKMNIFLVALFISSKYFISTEVALGWLWTIEAFARRQSDLLAMSWLSLLQPLVRLETFCTRRRPSLWWPIFPQDILLGILPKQVLLYFPLSVCVCHLLLSPLDLENLWNRFNRIRIMMGKFGCTQIQTLSLGSSQKDFF